MNSIDEKRIDLNLVRTLRVLLQEQSVTRAAEKMNLGQPALSHALNRLRALTGDPLFVREGRRLRPTSKAVHLVESVGPALDAIEEALRVTPVFEPRGTTRTFSVGLSDELQFALLGPLRKRMDAEAPRARLLVRSATYRNALQMLEASEVSTVMGYLTTLPAAAKVRILRECGYQIIRSKSDRRRLDLDRYCEARHALVTFAGDFEGAIDDTLRKMRRERHVSVSLPQFGPLGALLQQTNLIATVPDHVAVALASAVSGLRRDPLPFKPPNFDIRLAWRGVTDRDPAEIWFRRLLDQALKDSMTAGRVD